MNIKTLQEEFKKIKLRDGLLLTDMDDVDIVWSFILKAYKSGVKEGYKKALKDMLDALVNPTPQYATEREAKRLLTQQSK